MKNWICAGHTPWNQIFTNPGRTEIRFGAALLATSAPRNKNIPGRAVATTRESINHLADERSSTLLPPDSVVYNVTTGGVLTCSKYRPLVSRRSTRSG